MVSCLKPLNSFFPSFSIFYLFGKGETGSWESDLNVVKALVRLEWRKRENVYLKKTEFDVCLTLFKLV